MGSNETKPQTTNQTTMNTKQQTTIAIVIALSLFASSSTRMLQAAPLPPCQGMQQRNAQNQCACQDDQFDPNELNEVLTGQQGHGLCMCKKPWMTTDVEDNFKCKPIPNWCGVGTE